MKYIQYPFFLICLLISTASTAEEKITENIRIGLQAIIPDVKVDSIKQAPIDGLYEVLLGTDVFYMSADGRFVFRGELLDIQARRNLTEEVRSVARVSLLEELNGDDYIEFSSDKIEHAIYVFTDVDCGYCRKLHQDVPELNKSGIAVRYLAFPRAGADSETGKEMSAVWCAKDRRQAMTDAKSNQSFKKEQCNSPVAKQYELGRALGVSGTPAIYLESGKMLPGYLPPKEILKQLNR